MLIFVKERSSKKLKKNSEHFPLLFFILFSWTIPAKKLFLLDIIYFSLFVCYLSSGSDPRVGCCSCVLRFCCSLRRQLSSCVICQLGRRVTKLFNKYVARDMLNAVLYRARRIMYVARARAIFMCRLSLQAGTFVRWSSDRSCMFLNWSCAEANEQQHGIDV